MTIEKEIKHKFPITPKDMAQALATASSDDQAEFFLELELYTREFWESQCDYIRRSLERKASNKSLSSYRALSIRVRDHLLVLLEMLTEDPTQTQ